MRRRRVVLGFFTLLVLLLQGLAISQAPGNDNIFLSVRPDLTMTVRKHSLGADLVEVTATDANYPPEALRGQVQSLASTLGSELRGLRIFSRQVESSNGLLTFVSASFSVDRLMEPSRGQINLQAVVSSFGSEPRTKGMTLILDGLRPGADTILRYDAQGLRIAGKYQPGVGGLEYRIQFLSHEAKDLVIDSNVGSGDQNEASSPSTSATPVALWVALGLVGIAVGALVYSLALRSSSQRRSAR